MKSSVFSRTFLRAYVLSLFGPAALLTAASITNLSPVIGHPGDVIHINGSGFSPTASNNVVQFGPNRVPVLTATPTQLTVQVPNGQPLGSTTVSVGGVTGPKFNTVASAKIASIPPNPPGQCGACQCVACGCQDPNSSPCATQAPYLGGGPAGSIYGDRGEFFQSVTDLVIPAPPGTSPAVGYALRRQYRSAANNHGALGNKWNTSYFETLQLEGDGSVIDVDGLGRYDRYLLNNMGNFVAPPETYTTLVHNSSGSYSLQFKDR